MIKNEMNTAQLDIYNEDQYKEVFLTLDDNGDWEYTRLGFGEDHVGLYIVDLDDSGEQFRDKFYINEKFSVQDVLAEGVACGVFEKYDDPVWQRDYAVRVDEGAGDIWTLLMRVRA